MEPGKESVKDVPTPRKAPAAITSPKPFQFTLGGATTKDEMDVGLVGTGTIEPDTPRTTPVNRFTTHVPLAEKPVKMIVCVFVEYTWPA